MEIVKYEKKGNDNYLVYLSDGRKIKLNEEVILKYKLLYKKEIDEYLLTDIIQDNNNYDIYNKCVKYISVRLRSKYEMISFMKRKNVSDELITEVIAKLTKNKLLDDDLYVKAFISDKLKFTTMGPNRIANELTKQGIDQEIINKYLYDIDKNIIDEKINKQITKIIKSTKNKTYLKNKIYTNLTNLGYSYDEIMINLAKYNLD